LGLACYLAGLPVRVQGVAEGSVAAVAAVAQHLPGPVAVALATRRTTPTQAGWPT